MTIVAMQVTAAVAHPNADSLRVYELEAPALGRLTVVANLETVYEVGQTVAIARIGTVLSDGTKIRKSRLRGVDSFGMALEAVSDPAGSDLSARFGATEAVDDGAVALAKWPSIQQLHGVVAAQRAEREALGDVAPVRAVTYRAKVKLDGTNAALHALPTGFVPQSRTRLLTPDDDNLGFAVWAEANAAWARRLFAKVGRAVVYGEWCGPGIQRRTAVNQIPRRVFAVFAIVRQEPTTGADRIVFEPDRIAALLPTHDDVFVLPWLGEDIEVPFDDAEGMTRAAEAINTLVADVEATDPWVQATFGVEGIGEGVVLYPVAGVERDAQGTVDRDRYAALLFKAKGEAHRVARQKKPAQVDPEIARSVAEFVTNMVTEARLEQGLTELGRSPARLEDIGGFLRWVAEDVRKESEAELAAAGLTWKQVGKAVGAAAKPWFLNRAKRL